MQFISNLQVKFSLFEKEGVKVDVSNKPQRQMHLHSACPYIQRQGLELLSNCGELIEGTMFRIHNFYHNWLHGELWCLKLWYQHYLYAIGVVITNPPFLFHRSQLATWTSYEKIVVLASPMKRKRKKSELWVKSKGSLKTKNQQSSIWQKKGIVGEGQCNMIARIQTLHQWRPVTSSAENNELSSLGLL